MPQSAVTICFARHAVRRPASCRGGNTLFSPSRQSPAPISPVASECASPNAWNGSTEFRLFGYLHHHHMFPTGVKDERYSLGCLFFWWVTGGFIAACPPHLHILTDVADHFCITYASVVREVRHCAFSGLPSKVYVTAPP